LNTTATADFTTALARLLRDGAARDAYRANATSLAEAWQVQVDDLDAFLALDPCELETQAVVLLRKRLDQVARLIPRTLAALGEEAWPAFRDYARAHWPADDVAGHADAYDFCTAIREVRPAALCMAEWNRLRFLRGPRRAAIHLAAILLFPSRPRRALQLLLRRRNGAWREFLVYAG
jgi:hypothetical protein